jgi:hypothetical protein
VLPSAVSAGSAPTVNSPTGVAILVLVLLLSLSGLGLTGYAVYRLPR